MEIFELLIDLGHDLLVSMSGIVSYASTTIAELLPWDLTEISTAVPILGEFLQFTLFDVILGIGLPIVLGYTLIKWLLP